MPNGGATSTSRRALRYRLTLWLRRVDRPLKISELLAHLGRTGHPAPPPAATSVADFLRWEMAHGRVSHLRRGTCGPGRLDRRTAWWMQCQLDAWNAVDRVSESPDLAHGTSAVAASPAEAAAAPAWLTPVRPPSAPP
jgi:hypothetical protein